MTETFALGGINWCWYLQADIDSINLTARILVHTRFHNERDNHPMIVSPRRCKVIEDEKRNIITLKIDDVSYRVTNVSNVFSYNDFSQLK